MFRVGQKVVCVNPANTDKRGIEELRSGAIYTIRWSGVYRDDCYGGTARCVRLVEIPSRPCDGPWDQDLPFFASRFRPLAEKKADMEARRALFEQWQHHKERRVTAPLDEQA